MLAQPPTTYVKLNYARSLAFTILHVASVLERESTALPMLAARALGQANLGMLSIGRVEVDEPVEVAFGDLRITARGGGTGCRCPVARWLEGYYGALIARDTDCLRALRAYPWKLHMDDDAYWFAWRHALVASEVKPADAPSWAARAAMLTGPEFAIHTQPGVPELQATLFPVLAPILAGDEEAFNDALAATLRAHERRFRDEPKTTRGWLHLGALALACWARDRGLAVHVESEYLLPELIERGRAPLAGP